MTQPFQADSHNKKSNHCYHFNQKKIQSGKQVEPSLRGLNQVQVHIYAYISTKIPFVYGELKVIRFYTSQCLHFQDLEFLRSRDLLHYLGKTNVLAYAIYLRRSGPGNGTKSASLFLSLETKEPLLTLVSTNLPVK